MAYKLKRNGLEWSCEILKSAHLSSGYNVYLLKRETKPPFTGAFVVGCRKDDSTTDYKVFDKSSIAIVYYFNLLTCYA